MRQDQIWDTDTARRYDTPGTGMFAPEVLGPTVDRLAALAGEGAALEFAIGTGRVAVPLRARGVRVTGIELSTPMIDRLRTKAGEAEIPVITGDMATATAPGRYTLVYRDAKLYRTPHRYIWPAELDLMAQLAGFELESRHADWSGTEFTADSRSHVSVYRLG